MKEQNKVIPLESNDLVKKLNSSISITNKLITENNRKLAIEIFQKNSKIFLSVFDFLYLENDISKIEQFVEKYNNSNHEPKLVYDNFKGVYYYLEAEHNIGLRMLRTYESIDKLISRLAFRYIENNYNIDFIGNIYLNKLRDFVISEIELKISFHRMSKNGVHSYLIARILEAILEHIDELVSNVDKYVKEIVSINLDIKSDDVMELFLIEDFEKLDFIWDEPMITPFHRIYNKLFPKSILEKKMINSELYWSSLSSDESNIWDVEFIVEYKEKWNWERLSANKSLPLTIDLIEKFEENWCWDFLLINEKFPWSIKLIHKYSNKIKTKNYIFKTNLRNTLMPFLDDKTIEDVLLNKNKINDNDK